MHVEQKYI